MMRKHAEHEVEDTPYAPYAAWLDDQSVQPLSPGLLNKSWRSADKSAPDIERAAYADCDRDTQVAVLPDPLLLGSSAHADQQDVDVRFPNFLSDVRFFCCIEVARMETDDLEVWVTGHDVGSSPFDDIRLCTEEVHAVASALGEREQRTRKLDARDTVLDARAQHASSPYDANTVSNDQIRLPDNLQKLDIPERTSCHLTIQRYDEMRYSASHETVGYLEKLVNIPVADRNAKEVEVITMFPRCPQHNTNKPGKRKDARQSLGIKHKAVQPLKTKFLDAHRCTFELARQDVVASSHAHGKRDIHRGKVAGKEFFLLGTAHADKHDVCPGSGDFCNQPGFVRSSEVSVM